MYRVGYDAVADLPMLSGENDELNVLPRTVDEHIYNISIDGKCDISEDHHSQIVEDGPAGTYDDEVEVEQYTPKGDVVLLVDEGSNNVPSACAATGNEDKPHTYTIEECPQQACHRVLSGTK